MSFEKLKNMTDEEKKENSSDAKVGIPTKASGKRRKKQKKTRGTNLIRIRRRAEPVADAAEKSSLI